MEARKHPDQPSEWDWLDYVLTVLIIIIAYAIGPYQSISMKLKKMRHANARR